MYLKKQHSVFGINLELEWLACKDCKENEYNLLQILLAGPDIYDSWASQYYEIKLELTLIRRIFNLEPLDNNLLKLLNEEFEIMI